MINIWKLTISTFRLGKPKFSKISFTVDVDRNAVIKLEKNGKSNIEIAKWLDINCSIGVKDCEEVPGDRKYQEV